MQLKTTRKKKNTYYTLDRKAEREKGKTKVKEKIKVPSSGGTFLIPAPWRQRVVDL